MKNEVKITDNYAIAVNRGSKVIWFGMLFLFLLGLLQLVTGGPIGYISLLFTETKDISNYQTRFISTVIFYMLCITIYIICTLFLLRHRIVCDAGEFVLPYRGEILFHAGSIFLYYTIYMVVFDLKISSFINENTGDPMTFRFMEYVTYLGASIISLSWLGAVRLVYFGSKDEKSAEKAYLRGVTFMSED